MKRFSFVFFAVLLPFLGFSQRHTNLSANEWVDSVFKTLTKDQKIGQLMVVRLSSIGPNRTITFYDKQVEEAIKKYNIGGICLFQGGPMKQAGLINHFQSIAQTPVLICIDAENGLGMRMDSVQPLPRQMMMGAVQDPSLIYQYGRIVGEQCKRIGIQVNYAPVVDVNNNPNNPVINDRSFGEDKKKVADFGIQYMKGLQDVGVMACAKHFPGHGDVSVDSHHDLPVINKSKEELNALELYPFQQIVNAGIGSVMVAHLSIPAIDNTQNRPTSISYNSVTKLLRNELNFNGLTFTDALDMKGVTKYYPAGEASLQAVLAGNDMLCLPGDIPGSIEKIKQAIKKKKLKQEEIDKRVKRILLAKYQHGLANWTPIKVAGLTKDLNNMIPSMKRQIAENALTLLSSEVGMLPLTKGKRVAYVGVGLTKDNVFAQQVRQDYDAHVYYFGYKSPESRIAPLVELLKSEYDVVVIGLHNYARFPANNFGISNAALKLIKELQQQQKTITLAFGNPYAIKNFCDAKTLIACYEDDDITQQTAADLLYGRFFARGRLPVTICSSFTYGTGIVASQPLLWVPLTNLGFAPEKFAQVDSIIHDAIVKRAMPGAVLLVARDGKLAYLRSYGYLTYDSIEPVYPETIYDLASVTKIMATNVSVMKLYDEGKLDLQKTLGDYLPWVRGTNKEGLKLWDILLHQAGLKAWIPFYRETVDTLNANYAYFGSVYESNANDDYSVRVAENVYMKKEWLDTMYTRMIQSELGPVGKYVYSDNDFIFLGKIVESISGQPLEKYVKTAFYDKLNMKSTGFNPRERFPAEYIAPTESEAGFRQQLLQGYVHDPGAAMFGGIAGHAGLFSNAYDLAILAQVLLNNGSFKGTNFFKKETIDLFTAYHSDSSRRGLGFDKPEKDNLTRKDPYPALSASPETFGHTGFTGTCIWIDPKYNLTFILLANRVNNNGDANRFLRMNIRGKVLETIYGSLQSPPNSGSLNNQ